MKFRRQSGFDRSAEVCRPEILSARLKRAQEETGLNDAVINARGKLNGRPVIISAMEYGFIGGSMGAVVGEVITRAIEQAIETTSH